MVQPHSLPVQGPPAEPDDLCLVTILVRPRVALDELGAWSWVIVKPHPRASGPGRGQRHLAEGVARDRAEAARLALAALDGYTDTLVELARAYDLEEEDDAAMAAGGEA